MPLSTATISYDLSDLTGTDFDSRRTKVWVSTNIPSETVIDGDGNQIRLGTGTGTIADDGTGSVAVWVPGAGSNPASWQTYVHVDYPARHARGGRGSRTFGPFTITVSANLADLVTEMETPPEVVGGDAAVAAFINSPTSATNAALGLMVRPEWFGAAGDWEDTTATLGTGTDDTAAFQAAVDWVLANDGAGLALTSKYRIDGTVYINQTSTLTAVPFTIRGTTGNPFGSRGKGAAIIRRTTGDIFRVNLNSSGASTLPDGEQVGSLAVENVSIVGKSVSEGVTVTGINAFKVWRTRKTFRNIYASRLDYLLTEPDTDSGAVLENYCDQSRYENIRVAYSTLGGLDLYLPDASQIDGFYFENATATAKHAIQAYGAGSLSIRGFLSWVGPGAYTPVAGSSLIFLDRCRGAEVQVMHIERSTGFEAVIDAFGCYGVRIAEIASYYEARTFLLNRASSQVSLENWYSREDRAGSTYDIDIQGTTTDNVDVTWRGVTFFNYTGGAARSISTNGATGQSDGALDGQPRRNIYTVFTDANGSPGRPGAYHLPTITANRTLTLPSPRASGTGPDMLTIVNRNISAFNWVRGGADMRASDGVSLVNFPPLTSLQAVWDSTNSVWRVVAEASIGYRPARGATGATTLADSDAMFRANATGGAFNVTLPTAIGRPGKEFTIMKTDAVANTVTVNTTSAQTINGAATYALATQYKSVTVTSDGSNWLVIAST